MPPSTASIRSDYRLVQDVWIADRAQAEKPGVSVPQACQRTCQTNSEEAGVVDRLGWRGASGGRQPVDQGPGEATR